MSALLERNGLVRVVAPAGLELAYCPTGKGGGKDPTCSPTEARIGLATDRIGRVKATKAARTLIKKMFGPSTTVQQVRNMLGFPHSADTEMIEMGDNEIEVAFDEPGRYSATRALMLMDDGTVECENDTFFVEPAAQGKGLGATVFAVQAKELGDKGVTAIHTTAIRHDPDEPNQPASFGYKVWPKLGYDGKLDGEKIMDAFHAGALDTDEPGQTIQQLYKTEAGRQWWNQFGSDIELTFDPRPGSPNRKILDAYLARKAGKAAA